MSALLVIGVIATFGAIVLGLIGLRPPPPVEKAFTDDLMINRRRELIHEMGGTYVLPLRLAQFFGRYAPILMSEEKLTKLDRRLRQAGRPGALAAIEYTGVWIAIGAVLCFTAEFLCFSAWGFPTGLLGVASFSLVYFSGINWVEGFAKERIAHIERRLPYVMDIIMISIEAGSTFLGAIEQVVSQGSHEPLDKELGWMLSEIKLGRTRREAMQGMIERIGSEALTDSWNTWLQGEELGVPLVRSIRIQAKSLRGRRIRRAEKLANEAGTKVMAPSVLIMLAVLLLLLGPVIYQVATRLPM